MAKKNSLFKFVALVLNGITLYSTLVGIPHIKAITVCPGQKASSIIRRSERAAAKKMVECQLSDCVFTCSPTSDEDIDWIQTGINYNNVFF